MHNAIPIIKLTGNPYENGCAHGEAFKEKIRDFVDSITSIHQANQTYIKVDRQSLVDFCKRNLGYLDKHSACLTKEMQGIADGAGVSFDDILFLNSFLELEDLRAPGLGGKILPDQLWGCTTFNIPGEISQDGRVFIGQTYDMEKYYEKYLAILHLCPPSGPEALVVTLAGILGLNGINSAGIGAVINKITATDARSGVIYPFIMRKALAAERIGDALGAVIFSPRATGINYQLCGEGLAFCAETSATHYQLLNCEGGIAHTNHYLGSDMKGFETPQWLSHGGSMVRKQVADNFLKRHKGMLTPDLLKDLMKNHTNHPRCICAHGFPGELETTAFHTIFGVLMAPAEGWLEICPGNPCQNDFVRYSF